MKRFGFVGVLVAGMIAFAGQATAEGDAANGETLFKGLLACSSCHSLEAGEQKVGPTLVGLFGRKAGSVEGYKRYSKAMVNSEVVWDEETLNEFLKDPGKFIPGNNMVYQKNIGGRVPSDQFRADLIAYLSEATAR